MHAEHPFSARPRSTAIACMQGIHTTPSIPVQHPWEKKLDVRPAPSHQSAAVLFQPWDADVAVQHTPRHVFLELRPFRRVSTEEALQHQTTLVLKGSLDLMGTNGIVEIPAAHMPPPPPLSTRDRHSGRGRSCDLCPSTSSQPYPQWRELEQPETSHPNGRQGCRWTGKPSTCPDDSVLVCWRSLCARW